MHDTRDNSGHAAEKFSSKNFGDTGLAESSPVFA